MDSVETFLAPHPPQVRDLFMRVRSLIRVVMPDATEQVRAGHNLVEYGYGDGMKGQVCYIAPFKGHVNLGFFQGTNLPDPGTVLEGTGEVLRHVKIRSTYDLERPGVKALVEAAASVATAKSL